MTKLSRCKFSVWDGNYLWLIYYCHWFMLWNPKANAFLSEEKARFPVHLTNLLHMSTAVSRQGKINQTRGEIFTKWVPWNARCNDKKVKLCAKCLTVIYNLSFCLFTMCTNGINSVHMREHSLSFCTNSTFNNTTDIISHWLYTQLTKTLICSRLNTKWDLVLLLYVNNWWIYFYKFHWCLFIW